MFSAELKERTQQAHAELEKKLVTHIKIITTAAGYADLLEIMYGFYFPVQQKLLPYLEQESHTGAKRGRQAENILADIRYLYPQTVHSPALSEDLPEISTYLSSLGALYVLEGSTLGGRIITGMIGRQLGITTVQGFSFFNAYGEQTHAMWEDFKSLLNKRWTEAEKTEIADSAIATFRTFKNWINHYESAAHQ